MRQLPRLACLIAVCLTLTAVTPPAVDAPGSPPKKSRIDKRVTAAMEEFAVPGCSVAVIEDGKLAWAGGYGVVSRGGPAVDADTLFQAASVSKPVAASVALRLAEQGRLGLDDEANRHLKSWRVPDSEWTRDRPVTVRLILAHGAGFGVAGFYGYSAEDKLPSPHQILDGAEPARSPAVRVEGRPGMKARYSGGGYCVLQQLLADHSGKAFEDLARVCVLDPLGMRQSVFGEPDAARGTRAQGHLEGGTVVPGGHRRYPELAAAGLWTTPADLSALIIELQQACHSGKGKLFSRKLVGEMLTRQHANRGLGWELSGEGDKLAFGHAGANAGFRCYCVGFARTGQGTVIMTNGDTGFGVVRAAIEAIAAEYAWPDIPLDE